MSKLTCWDPHKKKIVLVGNLVGKILFRDVESKHFFQILQGYGIQEVAFQEFLEKGGETIIEKVILTNDMWKSSKKDWLEHGKVMNYGWGNQRFLSLKYMSKYTPKPNLDTQPTINLDTKLRLSEVWKEILDKKKEKV